jgi:hypothetical protein
VTDLELVTWLRRAIHGRCIRGSNKLSHDHHGADFPLDYVRALQSREVPTLLCGGAAQWLYHAYRSLGRDAFVLNTGDKAGPSHVVTFVRSITTLRAWK